MKDKKLFYVEFGKPDIGNWISIGGGNEPVYVIASSYDEAASKALTFAETRIENKSVVDSDGSLNIKAEIELQVKSVKVLSHEIIY